ncbi:MAG: MFS transporter [Gammaproteobacteria bacterium]
MQQSMLEKDNTLLSKQRWIIPWVVAIAMFMETLDTTILGTAIPTIARDFQLNPVDLKIALTSYLLSLSIFIPISGWIADKFNAKYIFFTAIGLFTLSSLMCGMTHGLYTLVLARFIQGIGASMMLPVGRLIVMQSFSKAEFAKAMQTVIVPSLLGPAFGPSIGGIILHIANWHWIFFVNIPFGILGLIITYWCIPVVKPAHKVPPLNWTGFLLFASALTILSFTLSALSDALIPMNLIIITSIIAVGLFVIYFIHSRSQPYPLLNLSLFKIYSFTTTITAGFLARIAISALPFLLPLLLQIEWGTSALVSGLYFLPFGLGMMLAKLLMIRNWLKRYGFRKVILINTLLLSINTVFLAFFGALHFSIPFIILLFIQGMLASQQYTALGTLYVMELKSDCFSQATSIYSTAQQLSAGFGVAIAAILLKTCAIFHKGIIFTPEVFFTTFVILSGIILLSLPIVFKLNGAIKLPESRAAA